MLINDMDTHAYDDMDLDRRMNKNQLSRRYFTVLAVQNVEGLNLKASDVDILKEDFSVNTRTMMIQMIQQT
jgi:hypothetical protein